MVNTAPERSFMQRTEALEKANSVRTRRAQLKMRINAGHVTLDRVLLAPPDYVKTMKIQALMMCVRGYGIVKVNQVLYRVGISPSKTVDGLSARQRAALVTIFRK